MERGELNAIYQRMEAKCREVCAAFVKVRSQFRISSAYFGGHYARNAQGSYEMDYFPIPVVTVKGLCDIEIGLEGINVSTKLKREAAIAFDYKQLVGQEFEVYGVEDYLNDFYRHGDCIETMLGRIKESEEKDIGFSFPFARETDGDQLYRFALRLKQWGFYY